MAMNENSRCSTFEALLPTAAHDNRCCLAIGGDHQAFGFRISFLSHRPSQSADRMARDVVIRADADPSDIIVDVVDARPHGTGQLGIGKIVDASMESRIRRSRFGPWMTDYGRRQSQPFHRTP
jgi:hypothetical protein